MRQIRSRALEPVVDPIKDFRVETTRSALIHLFTTLIEQISGPETALVDSSDSTSTGPGSWTDESYHYIEIDLAGAPLTDLDLSVTNGRAYLRVGR